MQRGDIIETARAPEQSGGNRGEHSGRIYLPRSSISRQRSGFRPPPVTPRETKRLLLMASDKKRSTSKSALEGEGRRARSSQFPESHATCHFQGEIKGRVRMTFRSPGTTTSFDDSRSGNDESEAGMEVFCRRFSRERLYAFRASCPLAAQEWKQTGA
jgi:hypothetical protein